MEETMRKVGRAMSIRMGIAMSFCLSLIGTLTSGHFTLVGFIVSFLVSSVISLIIGFILPIGKITGGVCGKMGLQRGSVKFRLMESFVSDLIYTPIMTLVMVFLAYKAVMRQSGGMAQLNYFEMLIPSLGICFLAGFVLIFLVQPIFMKSVLKKYNVSDF